MGGGKRDKFDTPYERGEVNLQHRVQSCVSARHYVLLGVGKARSILRSHLRLQSLRIIHLVRISSAFQASGPSHPKSERHSLRSQSQVNLYTHVFCRAFPSFNQHVPYSPRSDTALSLGLTKSFNRSKIANTLVHKIARSIKLHFPIPSTTAKPGVLSRGESGSCGH